MLTKLYLDIMKKKNLVAWIYLWTLYRPIIGERVVTAIAKHKSSTSQRENINWPLVSATWRRVWNQYSLSRLARYFVLWRPLVKGTRREPFTGLYGALCFDPRPWSKWGKRIVEDIHSFNSYIDNLSTIGKKQHQYDDKIRNCGKYIF